MNKTHSVEPFRNMLSGISFLLAVTDAPDENCTSFHYYKPYHVQDF